MRHYMEKKKLVPTYRFGSYKDISIDFLVGHRYKTILADLDDTLTEHGSQIIDDQLKNWINELKNNDISFMIVSNNSEKRVRPFAENLGVKYVSRAFKPSKKKILRNSEIELDKTTVLVGDQLFTDIKCAHNLNIDSILVKPLGNKTTFFIKIKRLFERIDK